MALFSKVKESSVEDYIWKDSKTYDWITFLLIFIVLGILFTIIPIYQSRYGSSKLIFLLAIPCLYGIYAFLSLLLHYKNAVFATSIYILQLTIYNLCLVISPQTVFPFKTVTFQCLAVCGIILSCTWLVYLYRGESVAVFFPKNQRKIYVFDWLAFLAILGYEILLIYCAVMSILMKYIH